jgi:hypothetical protein
MEEGKGILASDSTGVETDRYSYEIRPVKSKRKFAKIMVKQYLKWHVTAAILDHLIILNTRVTSKNTHDSPLRRAKFNMLKKCGVNLAGSIFNADRGYDGDKSFQSIFGRNCFRISTRKQTPTIRRTSTGRRLQAYSMYQYIITEY